jgi:hypothetical protein
MKLSMMLYKISWSVCLWKVFSLIFNVKMSVFLSLTVKSNVTPFVSVYDEDI